MAGTPFGCALGDRRPLGCQWIPLGQTIEVGAVPLEGAGLRIPHERRPKHAPVPFSFDHYLSWVARNLILELRRLPRLSVHGAQTQGQSIRRNAVNDGIHTSRQGHSLGNSEGQGRREVGAVRELQDCVCGGVPGFVHNENL